MNPLSLALALALAAVPLLAGRLSALGAISHRNAVSAAGGVSVSYVFVHLLPELGESQRAIEEVSHPLVSFFEHHAYLVALVGFSAFYGLERLAHRSRSRRPNGETGGRVFWVHVAAFATYSGIIGYLLVDRVESGMVSLLVFAFAMALHFLVTDYGLYEHHRDRYRRVGRWLLSAAVLVGWAAGASFNPPDLAILLLVAFLAGGVILNVIKEEVPAERESRFSAFAIGAGGYAALLLAL